MKTDKSIKNIVCAAIYRKVMNPEEWLYSSVHVGNISIEFELEENELPIFQVNSSNAKTLITTRQIIEKRDKKEIISVSFEDIDNLIYGDFKGKVNNPELSVFRIIDVYGKAFDFQMETGKASIGFINVVNTILKLKSIITKRSFDSILR
ncbi:hypothetical protein [Flavobacterium branchiicola]|uniref:Uncharacterized protein n=1 Tax=Flavobacterium branchiicola TaxID=1114875 RepID=A0ABV9PHE1_9FLAO|nr:hypothetical protein [Flavobacterium branchiicola]MBS7254520.1 hypothetical protein [Flavobacterium branchiicola]